MRKGFYQILIIVGILIIAVAIVVGIYYSQKSKPQNQTIPQQSPEQSATNTPSQQLVSINVRGGLCPNGECSSTTEINRDGTVLTGGKTKAILDKAQITKLVNLVDTQDYKTLKAQKFTETCPTAYDGSEIIYTFNSRSGTEVISSCEVVIDQDSPLFYEINQIIPN